MTIRRLFIRRARAFCSLPPACCRRLETRIATSVFKSLGLIVQRRFIKGSGNTPYDAGIMPALPVPSFATA